MAGRRIADLLIKIGADSYEFQQKLNGVENKLGEFDKKMTKLGKSLSLKLTAPLAALGGLSAKLADTQIQAESKLLRATSGRADIQQRLIKQASELQNRSTIGDEAIIAQQSYFATLKLTEQKIKDSTEAALQMSYAFKDQGMTFETASKYIGQMYGGTVGRLGMLIPQLKTLTAEQLKNGDGVQYMLKNYAGFAETAANEGLGPVIQMKNAWGDLLEMFGKILMPLIQKVAKALMGVVVALQSMSPTMQKVIVGVAGIAAAAGPLLLTLGAISRGIPMIAAGFTALLSPVGILTIAIATLAGTFAYAYIQKKKLLQDSADSIISDRGLTTKDISRLETENKALKQYVLAKKQALNTKVSNSTASNGLVTNSNPLAVKMQAARQSEDTASLSNQVYYLDQRAEINDRIISQLKEQKKAEDDATEASKNMADAINAALGAMNSAGGQTTGIIEKLKTQIEALENKKLLPSNTIDDIAKINIELEKLNKELNATLNAKPRPDWLKAGVKGAADGFSTVGGYKPLQADNGKNKGDASKFTAIDPSSVVKLVTTPLTEINKQLTNKVIEFTQMVNSLIQDTVQNLAIGIGESLGGIISGDLGFGNLLASIGTQIGGFLKQLGQMLITYAIQFEAFQKALKAIAKAHPIAAVAVGTAMIVAGVAISNMLQKRAEEKAPKLANGGLAYGPTYAMIGDNPNANIDPEVVAPLSKLRNIMGGIGGNMRIEIGGTLTAKAGDLALVLNKNNYKTKLING